MALLFNDKDGSFVNHIKRLQSVCESYCNDEVSSQEDFIVLKIRDLTSSVTENPSLCEDLSTKTFCQSITDLIQCLDERNNWDLFDKISCYIINSTDKSDSICESFVLYGMADVLINMSLHINKIDSDSINKKSIFIKIINIVHNIARHVCLQQYFLQHPNLDEMQRLIYPLCMDSVDDVSILATFVLIWLTKEDEQDSEDNKIIDKNTVMIKKIFQCIENTLINDENHVTTWSLCELLQGLYAMSSCESIKHNMIMLEEFVVVLIKIINLTTSSQNEIEMSLGILWNLSFTEANRELLTSKYDIEAIVKPLGESECETIRNYSQGFLWDLQKKPQTFFDIKKDNYDIFLSYSHDQKDFVSEIEKQLKKDFTVWIDKYNIKGDSLNDMASGIERSRIFVMCVSNSYKQSHFCHSEANYAYLNKKAIIPLIMEHKYQPDGWLGIIISSELYIDVSNRSTLSESMSKLTDVIKYRIETIDGSTVINKAVDYTKTYKQWTKTEVSEWLKANKLSKIQDDFRKFDGEMLDAMMSMRSNCPHAYYLYLESIPFYLIVRLDAKLSKLKS